MAMTTIKGPAIFLAQYAGDAAPYNSLDSICKWAASDRSPDRIAFPSGLSQAA